MAVLSMVKGAARAGESSLASGMTRRTTLRVCEYERR